MLYRYDQLNRLVLAWGLNQYDPVTGFAARGATGGPYDVNYTYDANGNLLTLSRYKQDGTLRDDMTYTYDPGTNRLLTLNDPQVNTVTYDEKVYNSSPLQPDPHVYRLITVQDAVTVEPGQSPLLEANESITLKQSFHAKAGSGFHARWTDAPNTETGDVNTDYTYDAIGNLITDSNEGTTITWTPYGKVRSVEKDRQTVTYRYDGAGNRIEKKVTIDDVVTTTQYVRDASGNVLAIYKDTTLIEQPVYGSSRLGQYRPQATLASGSLYLGQRQYELSNHLGNVLAVITDEIKVTNDLREPVIVQQQDYYPFGLGMEGRKVESEEYRYGFNGKEKDTDFQNNYDYGFRIYNPEIGKFLSVDPLTKSYPMLTPYQFASNTPIYAIDLDGLEAMPGDQIGGLGILEVLGLKNAEEINELVEAQARGEVHGAIGTMVGIGAFFGGNWLYNNWVYALYNPIFHNEIAATIYGTVTDGEWPIPAVGDNATKTLRYVLSGRELVRRYGDLIVEEGASFANDFERNAAKRVMEEGRDLILLAEKTSTQQGVKSGRNADFIIDGFRVDSKGISGVMDISSDNLSKQIADRINSASGQAEVVYLDLTHQAGVTMDIVKRGVTRAFGKTKSIQYVRAYGEDFDEIFINSKAFEE